MDLPCRAVLGHHRVACDRKAQRSAQEQCTGETLCELLKHVFSYE